MSLKKVYLTTKDVDVKTKYVTAGEHMLDTDWGVRAAMSALWLKKIYTAPPYDLQSTRPETWEAASLFRSTVIEYQAGHQNEEQFNEMMLRNCDLSILSIIKKPAAIAIEELRENNGYYYIDIGNHVISFVRRSDFFYFDPNYGLFHSNEGIDIVLLWAIKNIYGTEPGYRDQWLLYSIKGL